MWEETFKPAVEVTRGGIVESVHAAAVAICDPDGGLVARLGDPDVTVLLRSAAKPFQAAAVLASGAAERFGLEAAEIALVAGSHAGEPVHVRAVSSILSKAGLAPESLLCGSHVPFSRAVAGDLARRGEKASPLMNNCSGKHAGMLAAARAAGHSEADYLDPAHPVQLANREAISRFTGRPAPSIQVALDGCSAPSFAVSLRETATAFARLASIQGNGGGGPLREEARAVILAMRAHPEMVAGDGMLDTELMRAVPGLVAKVGADGIHAMGWPAGPRGPLGVALKVMDGEIGRGRTALILGLLRALGALPDPSRLPDSVTAGQTIRNHRRFEVGEVRPIFHLEVLTGASSLC